MIYTLHLKPGNASAFSTKAEDDARFDNLVAVPDTGAYWALVAPPLWLARYGQWFALLIYLGVTGLILTLLATPAAPAAFFLAGIPGLYLFLEGHQLRRQKLDRQGYMPVGVVEAPNQQTAVESFLARGAQNLLDLVSTKPAASRPGKRVFEADDHAAAGIGLFSRIED